MLSEHNGSVRCVAPVGKEKGKVHYEEKRLEEKSGICVCNGSYRRKLKSIRTVDPGKSGGDESVYGR